MEFVLDSNEYIFAFGIARLPASSTLLAQLAAQRAAHPIRLCRTIVEEVRVHLTPQEFREFIGFVHSLTAIDEDAVVPFEVGATYEWKGLKPADAFIAAYTEGAGAEALVTENRHFLSRRDDLPFNVLTAEQGLKFVSRLR